MTRKTSKSKNLKAKSSKSPRKPESTTTGPQQAASVSSGKTKARARSGRKRRGRKPRSRAGVHKTPAGQGAERLRASVNHFVSEEADDIADALVSKAKKGNVASAKIVIGLTGADHLPIAKKKKRPGLNDAERMAAEPQWDPSMENDSGQRDPLEPEPWDEEDERLLKLAHLTDSQLYTPVKLYQHAPVPSKTD